MAVLEAVALVDLAVADSAEVTDPEALAVITGHIITTIAPSSSDGTDRFSDTDTEAVASAE